MKIIPKTGGQEFFSQGLSQEEWLIQIMELYEDKVIRLAYTYVKDRKLAEDLAQEVFVKCFVHKDNFRSESSVKTWVYAITVNLCKASGEATAVSRRGRAAVVQPRVHAACLEVVPEARVGL